jgi:hypothetical protein
MRIISILLVLVSCFSHGSPDESLAFGNWKCDSFTDGDKEVGIFDVAHTVEYRKDGTSTDIHIYRLRGMEDDVWIKIAHSGPWKIEGTTLIEEAVETMIIDASIPELKESKEILQAISYEGETFISEIIELSSSKFITKDEEFEDAGTCVKV